VELELAGTAEGGLLLHISDRLFIGMGHTGTKLKTYTAGTPWRGGQGVDSVAQRISLKITNDHHVITFHTSPDGRTWTRGRVRFYAQGYDAATTSGGESLRVALFSAGAGQVRFRDFRYRGLG
jgi:xylan 1,4-beta-xylosidase